MLTLLWVHKSAMLQAIILENFLIFVCYFESLDYALVFEVKWSFCGAVLDRTKHLQLEGWIFQLAPISANLFVWNFCATNVTLVLNLNELSLNYVAQNFDDMSNDLIIWNGSNQLDLVGCLELRNGVFDPSDDPKILHSKVHLHINVEGVWNLSCSVFDQKYHTWENGTFQVYFGRVLNKQFKSRFVVCWLHINVRTKLLNTILLLVGAVLILRIRFNVVDNSHKSHFLFLDSLRDRIVLIKLNVVLVGTHEPILALFLS